MDPAGSGTTGSATGTAAGGRVVGGRYALGSRLGAGGMGTVWRARDQVLGREVAVKEVVAPAGMSQTDREVLFERTRREARAAARLDHPSAVTVFDVVEEGGTPFLVMELVPARTLAEVVRTDGPLPPARAAEVGLAVLGALEAAHRRGIVHRDVKPSNVLLGGSREAPGRVVLTDFGIATSAGDVSITSTGLLLGSPSYIAPERARGQSPGPASDLWSLGATLFTAVEGRPPFDGGDPLSTVTAVVTGEPAPFVAAGALAPVLSGLLARDPAERLDVESARVMLREVERSGDLPPGTAGRSGSVRTTGDSSGAAPGRSGSAPFARPARPSPAAVARADRTSAIPLPPAGDGLTGRGRAGSARKGRDAARPRHRGRWVAALAVVALLAAAAAGAAVLLPGRHRSTPSVAPTTTPSTTASSSPTPSPAVTPAVSIPASWQAYTEPTEGWTIFYPPTYGVSAFGQSQQFRDESTRYTLRVDDVASSGSAAAALQTFGAALPASLGGYQQLRLEPVEFRGWDAAELEFTYHDSGADLRVVDRSFVVDGRRYSLWWQTGADAFAASRPAFDAIAAAFVPAR